MKPIDIARVCHEVNKAYCERIGDTSQPTWFNAPDWQRDSCVKGVELHLADPHLPAAASHEAWLQYKSLEGWTWGETKDPEAKKHPSMVLFPDLPHDVQTKDFLFKAVVNALADHVTPEPVATAEAAA